MSDLPVTTIEDRMEAMLVYDRLRAQIKATDREFRDSLTSEQRDLRHAASMLRAEAAALWARIHGAAQTDDYSYDNEGDE